MDNSKEENSERERDVVGDIYINTFMYKYWGFPGGSYSKDAGDLGSISWLGRFPWRRECQHTPLPGEFHGQRSLGRSQRLGNN